MLGIRKSGVAASFSSRSGLCSTVVSAYSPRAGRLVLDQLDAVIVRIADEADARAALAYPVGRPLGLDAVLVLQRREGRVEVVDAERDVPIRGAQVVRAAVVVVGELEDVLLIAHREEVVRGFEFAVSD